MMMNASVEYVVYDSVGEPVASFYTHWDYNPRWMIETTNPQHAALLGLN